MSPIEKPSLLRQFFRYCLPTILSLWVFTLYTMVDGMFVARGVSDIALSAVNTAMPFLNVLFSVAIIFAVGTSTVVSILLGQGKAARANQVFTQTVVLLVLLGGIITIVGCVFTTEIALFLGAAPENLHFVTDYLGAIAPFSIGFIISYCLEILVKADGFPRLAAIAVITGALLNCVLDYLFVFPFQWGVAGAAAATGISQAVVTLIYLIHFARKRGKIHFARFQIDGSVFRRILPAGIPDGMAEVSVGVVTFLFNRAISLHIGVSAVTSYAVVSYVSNLFFFTVMGVSQGVGPLISFYHGAKESKTCTTLLRYGAISVAVISVIGTAITLLLTPQLVGIYIEAGTLALYTQRALRIATIAFFFVGYTVLITGYFTATERPRHAILLSFGRSFFLIPVCLFLLSSLFGGNGIWFVNPMAEFLCAVCAVIMLFLSFQKKDNSSDIKAH